MPRQYFRHELERRMTTHTDQARPAILTLAVTGIYFEQMVARVKPFEYRPRTPYWVNLAQARSRRGSRLSHEMWSEHDTIAS